MINRYQPHVLVLPEDDANRQMAAGFILDLDQSRIAKVQVLPEAGGWRAVVDTFVSVHIAEMNHYDKRSVILLLDFDGEAGRAKYIQGVIPDHLSTRVFVLGVLTEPERLKSAGLGSYEAIGRAMAKDCREETTVIWGHELLRHNASEIERLREHVRPILF